LQYGLADTLRTRLLSDERYEQRVRRAVALSEQLTAEHPDVAPYQSLAGDCLGQLAEIQFDEGDLDAAKENYERAIEYKRPLADRFRSELPAQISYARTLAGFAEVVIARNEIPAARALLNDAVSCLETCERERGPGRGPVSARLRQLLNQLQERRASLPPTES
jgi:tetratricopeptide (TPR) repeat protein